MNRVGAGPGGGGYSQKSWVGGCVRPPSQNPYPIYDQNLRFSLPYLWPGQKFDTLFMTVAAGTVTLNISHEGLLLIGLIDNDEKSSFFLKKTYLIQD